MSLYFIWYIVYILVLFIHRSGFINLDKPANPSSHEVICMILMYAYAYVRSRDELYQEFII